MTDNAVQALRVTPRGEITDVWMPEGYARLAAMYRQMNCESVEPVALASDLAMWCDEDGFHTDRPVVNLCATGVAARHGFTHQPYVGTVLFTGAASLDGETLELTRQQAVDLRRSCEATVRLAVMYRMGNPNQLAMDEVRAIQTECSSSIGLGA